MLPRPRGFGHAARAAVAVLVAMTFATTGRGVAGDGTGPAVALEPVAAVEGATAMAMRAGDAAMYFTLQDGLVVRVREGAEPETVLDLTALTRSRGEQGLLGLAFGPDGTHVYVHYSGVAAGETVIEEYAIGDGVADPRSRRALLVVPQPQANHNGGQIAFGPDGFLYIGLGDGGSQGDVGPGHAPGGNGQALTTLLGKILRIDPRPSGDSAYSVPAGNPLVGAGRPEIYVYGLRNPWRFSFDRKNGDLWIADVGQNELEEVTRLTPSEAPGANLGWNLFEGTERFRDGRATDLVMPHIVTSQADGNCSIIGGHVYRGRAIKRLRGWYLFSDHCNGRVKAAKVPRAADARVATRIVDLGIELSQVSSFGEDAAGELYVLSQDQGAVKIVKG